MTDTRIIGHDAFTATTTLMHFNETDGTFVIEETSDVESLIDDNTACRNEIKQKGDLRRVASIPLVILMDLDKRGILSDSKALARWLNDPDNRAFRTSEGRV